ncbi:MAG: glycosyltransferase [Deltaproteobacteria bacterium]|nr:glycosyltransferase [Deltaproteobacteria bacterium]
MWSLLLLVAIWGGYALFGRRWRIAPMLPAGDAQRCRGRVVAVVPARNEADELPSTLPFLLKQSYNDLYIVLVDDHSSDGTGDVARRLAAEAGAAERLVVISSPDLPAGWTGKVWAQQQGFEQAVALGADWVWFTDADIRHDSDVLERLLTAAEVQQRDFVSIMARLRCVTAFEKLLIPAFTYFFAGLYPFVPIGDDRSPQAGAAGGCMLIRRSVMDRIGGMAVIRDAVIDDVSLGRACKNIGARLWLGYHLGVTSTRGYPTLAAIWDMVARSAYTQLDYNPLALFGCVAGLAFVFFVPITAIIWGHRLIWFLGSVAYLAMTFTYRPMVNYLGCGNAWAFALPLSAFLYTGMTVSSALRYYRGVRSAWKGRVYRTPS